MTTSKDIIERDGYIIQPVSGDSMMPLLNQEKDAVRVCRVPVAWQVGDVPLYRRPSGQYVLHRIVSLEKKYALTRGDNRTQTEKVPYRWMVGRLEGYFKNGTYVSVADPAYESYVNETLARGRPWPPAEWDFLRRLLMCAVGRGAMPEPGDDLSEKKLLSLCEFHKVTATAAKAVREHPGLFSESTEKYFEEAALRNLRRCILFRNETRKVTAAFDKEDIPYLPLKGESLAALYPAPEMRAFSDTDILVRESDMPRVCDIMKSLGFSFKERQGAHATFVKAPMYTFEIHDRLFSPEFTSLRNVFPDVWHRLSTTDTCRMEWTKSDAYVFFLAHFYRHSEEGGGMGIRSFLDLFLLEESMRNDTDTVQAERDLDAWGLRIFRDKMSGAAHRLFTDDVVSEEDMALAMGGGAYGVLDRRMERQMRSVGKGRFLLEKIFPPYSYMKLAFPCVGRVPPLLPVMWVFRWVRMPFRKTARGNFSSSVRVMKSRKLP